MNKKGQTVGGLLVVAVAVIVCLVLFQQIAGNTDVPTNTATLSNGLYTAPAKGACIDLVGQELLSAVTVTNRTSGDALTANFTVSERISSVDGLKRIGFCTTDTLANTGDPWSGLAINVSYTYGREGYIEDSSGRAITGIIVLLSAVGIALIALAGVKKD